jgi:hypothetical protein
VIGIATKDDKEPSIPDELRGMRGHGSPVEYRLVHAIDSGNTAVIGIITVEYCWCG